MKMFEKHATQIFVFLLILARPENTSFVVIRKLTHDEKQLFINPFKKCSFVLLTRAEE